MFADRFDVECVRWRRLTVVKELHGPRKRCLQRVGAALVSEERLVGMVK